MSAAISVRDLTKSYAEGAAAVTALNQVSLDVGAGEVVLLAGPSGSGKTTLLSIMGCILQPTSGSVKIAGREVAGLSEKELPAVRLAHIGFVFQAFNLFPTLTAGENVELALDLKAIRGREARARSRSLLEQVGLGDKYGTFPADLSGGQKQRVAIARALIDQPELLLADEPTGNVDPPMARRILKLFQELNRFGTAVVIATHDLTLMDQVEARRMILTTGRLDIYE